jgi:hypothetical protein
MTTVSFGFPQFNIPPISPSGLWNREWYLFLHDLYIRTGGAGGQSIDSLLLTLQQGAGVEEVRLEAARAADAAGQLPPVVFQAPDDPQDSRMQQLEALVRSLANDVQALQQGTTP